jgi:Icc-related predicted phosphoesterase
MKILAVSDNVLPQLESARFLRETYSGIELVISCGDMPAPYLEYIVSILDVPLFFVRGNHDQEYGEGRPGGENLHRRVVKYKGLRFAGLEGSIRYNSSDAQYSQSEMSYMVLRMAPGMLIRKARKGAAVDVLVTHSPPWQIHDLPDHSHRGFKAFRRFMDWYQPRYLLHGHVDTWDRRRVTATKYNSCEVININPAKVVVIDERT